MKLQAGDKAPYFEGVDQDDKPIKLTDFTGKKLLLYFYPKDNTPGCTAQACNLRDHYSELKHANTAVVGVSGDSVKSHKKFEDKYSLPFPLIADTDHSISEAYGVWGPKKFMGRTYNGITRTTFLIDEQGIIKNIIEKPDTKNQTQQAQKAWQAT